MGILDKLKALQEKANEIKKQDESNELPESSDIILPELSGKSSPFSQVVRGIFIEYQKTLKYGMTHSEAINEQNGILYREIGKATEQNVWAWLDENCNRELFEGVLFRLMMDIIEGQEWRNQQYFEQLLACERHQKAVQAEEEKERKTHLLAVKIKPSDYKKLEELAEVKGVSVPTLVRNVLENLGEQNIFLDQELRRNFIQAANNLNQLSRHYNAIKKTPPEEIQELKSMVKKLNHAYSKK